MIIQTYFVPKKLLDTVKVTKQDYIDFINQNSKIKCPKIYKKDDCKFWARKYFNTYKNKYKSYNSVEDYIITNKSIKKAFEKVDNTYKAK